MITQDDEYRYGVMEMHHCFKTKLSHSISKILALPLKLFFDRDNFLQIHVGVKQAEIVFLKIYNKNSNPLNSYWQIILGQPI